MLHFKHIGSETKEVTHDLAAEFSKMTASVTERDLDPKRVTYLKSVVLGGTALPFIWARAKVAGEKEYYRVNGHHSSTMLASLNGELPEGLVAHIDDYEVATLQDLPLLFRQFDSRKSARSTADISGAYQMIVPELRNAGRIAARKAIEGVAWFDNRIIGANTPTGDDVFVLFNQPKYHDYIHMVDRIYSAKTPEFTLPVLGAIYGTFEKSASEAETFWTDVSKGGGSHDERHPSTVLDAWLLAAKGADKKPKPMEVYRACVITWNAFRASRSLDKIGKWDPKKGAPDLE
jgi:hypothetical protein